MARTYPELDVESDFGGQFPFESRKIDVGGGVKMAYVDEGPRSAPLTFLLLHGNPTWGFLYRRFIPRLWKGFRVVVPDHVGFGRSDKPVDPEYYTLERHIRNLDALVKHLKLRNVVPVLHDWGGPIGMGWATRNPDACAAFVVLNTWAFVERPELRLPWLYRFLFTGKAGARRIVHKNFFTEAVVARAGTDTVLSSQIIDAYRAPHPTPEERIGVARFPQLVPQTDDVSHETWSAMRNIEHGLQQFSDHPALIVWAMRDAAFRKQMLQRWQEVFPAHTGPVLLPNAKHYLQEDEPDAIIGAIEAFGARLAEKIPKPQRAPTKRTSARNASKPEVQPDTVEPAIKGSEPAQAKAPPPPQQAERVPVREIAPALMPQPPAPTLAEAVLPQTGYPVAAEVVDGSADDTTQGGPAPDVESGSHLVEDRDPQDVKRVAKRDAGGVDHKKPRSAKPRVVRRKDRAVAVERTERTR